MPPGPPKILEWFFGIWIPPACREEVLGDLYEKYSRPLQYVLLAIRTIPCVIFSRARRVTEAPVLFMQALLVYGCYLVAAFYRDSAFLSSPYGLLRAALPLAPFLLVTVLFDVYRPPARSALQLAGRVAFAILIAFLMMARFACGANSVCLARTLPDWMNLLGSCAALLLVTALRLLFRSDPNIGQAAGSAHWLKQTPAPIAVPWTTVRIVVILALFAASSIALLSAGVHPGIMGAIVVFVLLFGPWGIGRRKG